ncbi:MAG: type II toxin-antitoxin system RelE/ParE family toxin [Spirochaetia bacterium]|nr:type II toxin-antitoxin system RelE/ParE family toxin [Spirochaetia bacterium]
MPQKVEADLPDLFKIFETDQFLKDLKRLRIKETDSRYQKIHNYVYPQLRVNPYYGKNIKKLRNWSPETWRYRVGDYRVFYIIDDSIQIVSITSMEQRDKAY